MNEPEQIVDGYGGRIVYQRRLIFDTGPALFRFVTETEEDGMAIVTVYLTTKIKKYWSEQ